MSTNIEQRSYVICDKSKGFGRVTEKTEWLGQSDDLIAKAVKQAITPVMNAFRVADIRLHIAPRSKNHCYVWGRLPFLRISSYWEETGGIVHPSWVKGKGTQLAYDWYPANNMALVMLMMLEYSQGRSVEKRWAVTVSWLLAHCTDHEASKFSKGYFRLPMSNLFNDGKVCTGEVPPGASDPFNAWDNCVNHIFGSVWGGDLKDLQTPEQTRGMFGFNYKDNKQVEVPADWPKLCGSLSDEIYNRLACLD